jgi:sortase (surface protein transpeptidase)
LERASVQGFDPIDLETVAVPGGLTPAIRLRIPAINVDSKVEELILTDLGDSRAYNTPKHVVGHIPELANAGENGTAWFFGHLESPIQGEGSVFRDLPKIPELWREGVEVYAIVDNDATSFLYRLSSSEVLPENELRLYDTEEPTIRLVTCVPPLLYDHRLVIWGELVGTKSN